MGITGTWGVVEAWKPSKLVTEEPKERERRNMGYTYVYHIGEKAKLSQLEGKSVAMN